ncbi:MAG: branched-chain-amino-acid transaminase [Pseudomonadota bacterium]
MAQDRLIWFKGDLMPAVDAKVQVLSPTAQFGLNVFEGIRGYWSDTAQELYLFRLKEHLDRLFDSCRLIGITCPYSAAQIEEAIVATLRANDYRADIAVRATVFVDGEGTWSSSEPVDMFVAPIAKARRPLDKSDGQSACIATWQRISEATFPPRIKAGANYINGRYAHLEAQRNGYDLPVLLGADGKVSEGAGSCLFMVRNGVVATPSLTSSVLESITRDTLLDLARGDDMVVEDRSIDRTELYLADELFLCGSAAELSPLTSIDQYQVGSGAMGPVTARLLKLYMDAVADAPDPAHPEWRTPVYQRGE